MGYPTLIHERVEQARQGRNPAVICRVRSGWAVLGDTQFVPGYSLLLPDPVVPSLNDICGEARTRFLDDMAALGDAVLAATGASRVNYSILGNLVPALHAHVFPRYAHEPDEMRNRPVWMYAPEARASVPFDPERDRAVMDAIRRGLVESGGAIEHE
ncbi:MAG: HIT family protein [Phycisphaerales bacterium JB064]